MSETGKAGPLRTGHWSPAMANFLAMLAFSGLIAAQFLAVVFAHQYRSVLPAERPAAAPRMLLARREA